MLEQDRAKGTEMTSLYETALNGMGLGTKADDIDRLYADHQSVGQKAEAHLVLEISMKLMDLSRAEGEQKALAMSLERAAKEFAANPTTDRADWLVTYAKRAEKATREAKAAYSLIGILWCAYAALTA